MSLGPPLGRGFPFTYTSLSLGLDDHITCIWASIEPVFGPPLSLDDRVSYTEGSPVPGSPLGLPYAWKFC